MMNDLLEWLIVCGPTAPTMAVSSKEPSQTKGQPQTLCPLRPDLGVVFLAHAIVKANHSQTQWKGRYNLPLCGKGSEELAAMILSSTWLNRK